MDTRMTKRRNFSDKFKATVALEALRGDKTVQEIASKRQLHPTQMSTWKRQTIEGMANVFSDKVKKAENKDGEIEELHAEIGRMRRFGPIDLAGSGPVNRSEFVGDHQLK